MLQIELHATTDAGASARRRREEAAGFRVVEVGRRRVEREAAAHDRLRALELLEADVDAGASQLEQRTLESFARQQLAHVVGGKARVVEQCPIGTARVAEDPAIEHAKEVVLAAVQALL